MLLEYYLKHIIYIIEYQIVYFSNFSLFYYEK